MTLLSIDSGIEKTGFAIFSQKTTNSNEPKLIYSGIVKTGMKLRTEQRLEIIYREITEIIKKYSPQLMVVERLFFFRNQKTAIQVSQTQGVILLLASLNHIEVRFLTPLQIKQIITGYGQSDKKAIQKMLKLSYNLNIPPDRDDEADAIACGLAYCYLHKNLA